MSQGKNIGRGIFYAFFSKDRRKYTRRRLFLFSREWGIEQYSWRKCCDIFSELVGNGDQILPGDFACEEELDSLSRKMLNCLCVARCGRPDSLRTVNTLARSNMEAELNMRQETDTLDQPHVDDTGMSETLWTTPMWDYFKMHRCG